MDCSMLIETYFYDRGFVSVFQESGDSMGQGLRILKDLNTTLLVKGSVTERGDVRKSKTTKMRRCLKRKSVLNNCKE